METRKQIDILKKSGWFSDTPDIVVQLKSSGYHEVTRHLHRMHFATMAQWLQGQSLLKGGKPIESVEDNLSDLKQQAEAFALQRLGILQALNVACP